MDQTVWQTAWPIAPPMKMMSAMARTGLRPVKSLSMPAIKPPMSAPRVVADVTSSYPLVFRGRLVMHLYRTYLLSRGQLRRPEVSSNRNQSTRYHAGVIAYKYEQSS